MNDTNKSSQRVYIQEVSLRDGFQIEPEFVPTEKKIELVNRLSTVGISRIEVSSFTSPKAIPALADAADVFAGIQRLPDVVYAALVPNLRGCERALLSKVDELNVVVSASETHNRANLRMPREKSLEQVSDIVELAGSNALTSVSIATAFGCPFEGEISESDIYTIVESLASSGITSIALCDTTGMANPSQVRRLFESVLIRWPNITWTAHFHNTRGMGLANVVSALEAGIVHFDASLGGLGGCPFAPGASGNICTEDLTHMLQTMGYDTRVDLDKLIGIARDIPDAVGHEIPGQVMKAGPSSRQHQVPDWVENGAGQASLN